MIFSSIGKEESASAALAEALQLEKRFDKAGAEYLKLGRRDEALECLWRAGAYREIEGMAQRFPELSTRVEHRASSSRRTFDNLFLYSIIKFGNFDRPIAVKIVFLAIGGHDIRNGQCE